MVHGDVSHYKQIDPKKSSVITFFSCVCKQCDPSLINTRHGLLEVRQPGPAHVAKEDDQTTGG